jgi:hypothetical protein
MKHLTLLFTYLLTSAIAFSQGGVITSISIDPQNPTENDDVTIYVNVQFNYGGCELDDMGFGLNGNVINANAHHCIGLLAVICPTTDTFQLGQMAAGSYTFDFTLTSGAGGPNCSPGIVSDDNQQLQFTVSPSVGIEELEDASAFLFPNPTVSALNFKQTLTETAIISDLNGRKIMDVPAGKNTIEIDHLPQGAYLFRYRNAVIRLIKED